MEIKEKEKIIQILNELALLEFKTNYNLSEVARIIDVKNYNKDPEVKKLRKALLEILPKETKSIKYHISNMGMLEIDRLEDGEIPGTYIVENRIFNTLQIPYSYVMGKPIGKRAAKKIVEILEKSFIRYAL